MRNRGEAKHRNQKQREGVRNRRGKLAWMVKHKGLGTWEQLPTEINKIPMQS